MVLVDWFSPSKKRDFTGRALWATLGPAVQDYRRQAAGPGEPGSREALPAFLRYLPPPNRWSPETAYCIGWDAEERPLAKEASNSAQPDRCSHQAVGGGSPQVDSRAEGSMCAAPSCRSPAEMGL